MGLRQRVRSWRGGRPSIEIEAVPPSKPDTNIPCGICRRTYGTANLDRFFAHLSGHFDDRYRLHRCEECCLNFVCQADLDDHLLSVKRKHTCGYMFEHKEPCTGHHSPRAFGSKDDSRFDFCYRVQGWERAQLREHDERIDPKIPGTVVPTRPRTTSRITDFVKVHLRTPSSKSTTGSRTPPSSASIISKDLPPLPAQNTPLATHALLDAVLLRAICTGSTTLVSSLLLAGATPTFVDTFGFGAMHYAAQYGTPEIAWLLIQNGASIDIRDQRNNTPLLHAIRSGNIDAVRYLITRGRVGIGMTEVDVSLQAGDHEIARIMLERWRREGGKREQLDRSLIGTVKRVDEGMVNLLLEFGARVSETKDRDGRNVIAIAATVGDRRIVKLLTERAGLEAEARASKEKKILERAARAKALEDAEGGAHEDSVLEQDGAVPAKEAKSLSSSGDDVHEFTIETATPLIIPGLQINRVTTEEAKSPDADARPFTADTIKELPSMYDAPPPPIPRRGSYLQNGAGEEKRVPQAESAKSAGPAEKAEVEEEEDLTIVDLRIPSNLDHEPEPDVPARKESPLAEAVASWRHEDTQGDDGDDESFYTVDSQ